MVCLAGDIGGTKSHLALFERGNERKWLADAKFRSSDYSNLIDIVQEFVSSHGGSIEAACFGVAGPVQDNICRATNLPWVVDGNAISEQMGIPQVSLINDLEANSWGIPGLGEDELFVLNEGKEHVGNRALISAGTGLGEAGIYWDGERHRPFSSEGGHCTFAPENELEVSMRGYLMRQYDHVSYERLLSGKGLVNLYRFFIDTGLEKELDEVREAFEKEDPAKVITDYGVRRACSACARAVYCFVEIYGSEAGNLALKLLSVGGLYIGGGIAPKILNALKEGGFMKRFINKGRFTSLLLAIPVKVILTKMQHY